MERTCIALGRESAELCVTQEPLLKRLFVCRRSRPSLLIALGLWISLALGPQVANAQLAPNVVTSSIPYLDTTQIATPGYVILENASVASVGIGTYGPNFRIQFNPSPSRFKQQFTTPKNIGDRDMLTWIATNHENRTVNITILFQVQQNLSDYTGSLAYQMSLPPNSSTRYLMVFFTPNPADWGLKAFPKPYDTAYTQINVSSSFNRSSIYAWRFTNSDSLPAAVTIEDFSTLRMRRDLNGIADPFFQYSYRDWPGKTTSVMDMQGDWFEEQLDLGMHPGQIEIDGASWLPNQGPSDRWRIMPVNGKYYFINRGGKPFWSMGLQSMHMNTATWIDGRESMFQYLPDPNGQYADYYGQVNRFSGVGGGTVTSFQCVRYNLRQKYGSGYQGIWYSLARQRIRSWGFNTVAPFCETALYDDVVPYTLMLDTFDFPVRLTTAPSTHWMTMPDPYDLDFESYMTTKFANKLAGHLSKVNFMGVFVDNEQSWGHIQDSNLNNRFTLALGSLAAPYTQPAKRALLTYLTTKYQSVTLLNQAWNTTFANWTQLRNPFVKDGNTMSKAMRDDMAEFTRRYAATYFLKVRRSLTAVGMNQLYLGCRFWYYTPEVVGAALPYVDALSFNNYSLDNAFPWTYLANLNKPIIISEWSNPINARGSIGWTQMDPQQNYNEIVRYFTSALQKPYVVGVHWYEAYDSPVSGIAGSYWNVGFGILDVTDKPKPEVVSALRYIGDQLYYIRNGGG
ncbi:MAG: hypothetical protein K1X67_06700 [Fimbriimonadaceae bacterium]|nr:hypothetical protein [Fimbriimonadaceae bacterium]